MTSPGNISLELTTEELRLLQWFLGNWTGADDDLATIHDKLTDACAANDIGPADTNDFILTITEGASTGIPTIWVSRASMEHLARKVIFSNYTNHPID